MKCDAESSFICNIHISLVVFMVSVTIKTVMLVCSIYIFLIWVNVIQVVNMFVYHNDLEQPVLHGTAEASEYWGGALINRSSGYEVTFPHKNFQNKISLLTNKIHHNN